MRWVLEVLRASFRDLWGDLWTVAVCNLLWLISNVLIIPGPPATLALFYYTNRLAHGEVVDVSDYLYAFRRNWRTAWTWGAANLLMIAILAGDLTLTGKVGQGQGIRFVQGFYLAALGAWFIVQMFALPFLYEQEQPSLRQAMRNGAVLIGRNLGFSMGLGLLIILILLAGTGLFLLSMAAGGVFVGLVGNHAVLNRLEMARAASRRGNMG